MSESVWAGCEYMNPKVVAYITAGRRLLVFEHVRFTEARVQVVQGTVEGGETPKDAVMREAEEETG